MCILGFEVLKERYDLQNKVLFSGMNTGVQDAHNLAWKIAAVLNDIAPFSFLSSYEMERKQVVFQFA